MKMDGVAQGGFWDTFRRWLKHPFSIDMTAGEWFLFVGLLLVILVLWNIILYRITELVRAT
jgi:hypothetical protein